MYFKLIVVFSLLAAINLDSVLAQRRYSLGLSRISQSTCGDKKNDDVYPWIAILEHESPDQRFRSISKGFLVNDRHVLTSVSSVHNSEPGWRLVNVRLNCTPSFGPDGLTGVSFGIENIFIHEKEDLAVLRLDQAVNITDFIKPICLPDNEKYDSRLLSTSLCKRSFETEVYGEPPKEKTTLITEKSSLLDHRVCNEFYRRLDATLGEGHLCAWDIRGDTCTGDFGGPLMGLKLNKYTAIGVASYLRVNTELPPNVFPSVYTSILKHLDWINKQIKIEPVEATTEELK